MHAPQLESDYLIVGSGAAGMAFADTIFHESSATMTIVDRHHGPGGHWNDAYPFVRLHQPSSFYGVNSRKLGNDGYDTDPLNAGMTERASSAEILSYYETLMQQMVTSGRVRYLPMSNVEVRDASSASNTYVIRSLLSGATTQVHVHRKVVDTSWLNTGVPSTHPPKYAVADGVQCMPLNDLARVKRPPSGYVVVGAGKTGIDACLWLLANQVPADMIRWVMPRDSWFLNRANVQASDAFFVQTFDAMATQFEAIAQAQSMPQLFQKLEATGQLLRLDPAVEPGMYHAAVVSQAELQQLRSIKDIVRLGRVTRIDTNTITLEHGTAPMDADRIVVDCSASAAEKRDAVPVFQGRTITLQFIKAHQPTLSAALIAHVELRDTLDEAGKNKLCKPVPMPDTPITWLTMLAATMSNRDQWGKDQDIAQWLVNARLDAFAKMMDSVQEHELEKVALMERMGAAVQAAVKQFKVLLNPGHRMASGDAAQRNVHGDVAALV